MNGIKLSTYFGMAYCLVHSLAVLIAACSSSFQLLAKSAARGSSGLGAPSRAWIDNKMVRICKAGDQLSVPWYRMLACEDTSPPKGARGVPEQAHFSGRLDRCGPACRRLGGRSWLGTGSWAASLGNRLVGRVRA